MLDKKNDKRLTSLENLIDNIDRSLDNKVSEGITQMKKKLLWMRKQKK